MFIFCAFVRVNFKFTKQRDKMFWLSTPDKANCEAYDSENGKLNYSYADLKNYYRKILHENWAKMKKKRKK